MFTFVAQNFVHGGIEAFYLKSVNLLIHLGVAALVYIFALQVLAVSHLSLSVSNKQWVAFIAVSIWVLAPLHVSTVLYAVQRMTQLSALFVLSSLIVFMFKRRRWARNGATIGDVVATALWLFMLIFLATFSKENGALALWLITALEFTLFKGEWAGRKVRWLENLGVLALCFPLLVFFLVLFFTPHALLSGYYGREFTVEERLLTQARLLWQYVFWIVLPDINSMGFQHDDVVVSTSLLGPVRTVFAVCFWGVCLLSAIMLKDRLPLFSLSVLFYLIGHFMESGIWPLEMVYEHRNYLPSISLAIFLALGIWLTAQRCRGLVRPRLIISSLLVLTFTALALRVYTWADPIRLSSTNVHNHPNSSRSHFFLADALLEEYSRQRALDPENQQVKKYLIMARHHLEVMHQKNPRDVAALVLLHYMDSYHFPALGLNHDWIGKLKNLLLSRKLQPSDWTALDTLVDCMSRQLCEVNPRSARQFFDILHERFPRNSSIDLFEYRYLSSGNWSVKEKSALLYSAQKKDPGNTRVYQQQILERIEIGDMSGVYESVRHWLLTDRKRREILQISRLFGSSQYDMTLDET
ncbi:hypothetical protein E2F43_02155 [Seongchinamella unica]|uniref:Uncharacterized protein n=1 Tax=Seongchinamella unica TaxID=2547392 RepID=A0A4V2ZXI2_9GAMM|nr:hypothetical protein [Seongchinamella unica]TDG15065.1 hypothetical protein E2F43_02155 [Seongchinamella unica]